MCHFWTQNDPLVMNKFFWYKPLLLLSSTYWPFSISKILKNSCSGSRVMRMHHFWAQNSPFVYIFLKIIKIILIYLLAPFIVQNFSLCKILPADPELWGCTIFGPKIVHFPNKNFFRKTVNEPCFFHSCLFTCQK